MSGGETDCGADVAAYVLGALEPHESGAFAQHLEQCAVCRDEVSALEGVVQALPMSAPQQPVPRRLRRRVMRAVRADAVQGPARGRSVPWRGGRWAMGALAAAAVVAVAIVAGISLSSGGSARVIDAQLSGISGSAQLRLSGGRAELVVRHLSPPPAGHVYEVWLKPPHADPVPASVLFSVAANGSADVGLPMSVHGISEVLVTPEPGGGSAAPTHRPVIVAKLS